jgi:hypothetical protein
MEMGLPVAFMGTEPEFVEASDRLTAMSKKYRKPLMGAAITPEMVEERLRQGFTLLVRSIDLFTLAFGTVIELATARAAVEAYMQRGNGHA